MAIIHMDIFSNELYRHVNINVILPLDRNAFGFEPAFPNTELKTLYLLHGIIDNENSWLNGTRIAKWATENNLCVVMPAGENGFYVDHPNSGRNYSRFICEELVKVTRRIFPLSHKREDTFIGGLSMGGYGALRNGLKYSDVFGWIVALSSGLVLDQIPQYTDDHRISFRRRSFYETIFRDVDHIRGSDADVDQLLENLVEQGKPVPEIFLCCGTEDSLYPANEAFHQHLEKLKVPHRWVAAPGAHSWDFWNAHIQEAIETFLPVDLPPEVNT